MDILHSILRQVYFFLKLLNANPHGKGLGLHGYALGQQGFKSVSGAVANGQHRMVTGNHLAAFQLHAGKPVPIQTELCNSAAKTHLATQCLNPAPEVLNHLQKHIRSHMGLGIIQNILLGTGGDELL